MARHAILAKAVPEIGVRDPQRTNTRIGEGGRRRGPSLRPFGRRLARRCWRRGRDRGNVPTAGDRRVARRSDIGDAGTWSDQDGHHRERYETDAADHRHPHPVLSRAWWILAIQLEQRTLTENVTHTPPPSHRPSWWCYRSARSH